jgi:hypothetical protein
MSKDYADEQQSLQRTLRAAKLYVLWHHQGGFSEIGQPIRKSLGIGPHDSIPPSDLALLKTLHERFASPEPASARSDVELRDLANQLARDFARVMGVTVPDGHRFDLATNARERQIWTLAEAAFDRLEQTDLQNVLDELEDEPEAVVRPISAESQSHGAGAWRDGDRAELSALRAEAVPRINALAVALVKPGNRYDVLIDRHLRDRVLSAVHASIPSRIAVEVRDMIIENGCIDSAKRLDTAPLWAFIDACGCVEDSIEGRWPYMTPERAKERLATCHQYLAICKHLAPDAFGAEPVGQLFSIRHSSDAGLAFSKKLGWTRSADHDLFSEGEASAAIINGPAKAGILWRVSDPPSVGADEEPAESPVGA